MLYLWKAVGLVELSVVVAVVRLVEVVVGIVGLWVAVARSVSSWVVERD